MQLELRSESATPAWTCPNCAGETINVQGLSTCPDCEWVERP